MISHKGIVTNHPYISKNRFVSRRYSKISFVIFSILISIYFTTRYTVILRWREAAFLGLEGVPDGLTLYATLPNVDTKNSSITLSELKKFVQQNTEYKISHTEHFGFVKKDTTVIMVQVHKDIKNLQYLIMSLGMVTDIYECLLIFSHSFYHEQIDALIKSINFCRVLQIFYPYSPQLLAEDEANFHKQSECDDGGDQSSCSRLEAELALSKRHWWWKAQWVFERVPWAAKYHGTVLFLEEDNLVAPDALYMLEYVRRIAEHYTGRTELLSLGGVRRSKEEDLMDLVGNHLWAPPYHRGLAFNSSVWRSLSPLRDRYCGFDDRRWSHSLLHALHSRARGPAYMAAVHAPRVLAGAGRQYALTHFRRWTLSHKLYPDEVRMPVLIGKDGKKRKQKAIVSGPGNGGWTGMRDRRICGRFDDVNI